MFLWLSHAVSADPYHALSQYVQGRMPDWVNGHDGEVAWIKREHRGVQWLDKIQLPKKSQHLKYILQPKFEIKFDTAFEEVIAACADLKREGKTWIGEEISRCYIALHKMGFAHSFEAWDGDKLVAGAFGLQMGALMSIDSVFHHVSNAGMAVYGQTLLRLRDRGFKLVDVNYVSGPFARFGEEWVPQWKFEELLGEMLLEHPALADDQPAPALPLRVRCMLPLCRGMDKAVEKLGMGHAVHASENTDEATAVAADAEAGTPAPTEPKAA